MSKVRRPDSISLLALARCFEKLVAKITSAFLGVILFSVCCVVMGFAHPGVLAAGGAQGGHSTGGGGP